MFATDGSGHIRTASLTVLDVARCKFNGSVPDHSYPFSFPSPSPRLVATYRPALYPASYHDNKSASKSGDVPGGTGGGGRDIAARAELGEDVRVPWDGRAEVIGGGGSAGIGADGACAVGADRERFGSEVEVRRLFLFAGCDLPFDVTAFSEGFPFCCPSLSIASRCERAARS